MSKSKSRYQRVSQSQEKEESDGEETTLFDNNFGEGVYNEEDDLRFNRSSKSRARKTALKVVPSRCPNWLYYVLVVAVLVLTVLLISLVVAYIVAPWRSLPGNCTLSPPGSTNRISWDREFFPGFTESSPELQDMNGDGIVDIIIVDASARLFDQFARCPGKPDRCQEEEGFSPCRVHLVAMCGTTGEIIWEKWLDFEAFALRCSHDLNRDAIPDCIVAGRSGSFAAINGSDGSFLWHVDPSIVYPKYNFFYPLVVEDMDSDGIVDIINMHGGDSSYKDEEENRSPAFLVVVSGRTGQKLMEWVQVPDGRESYNSPILFNHPDGSPVVLFGTGGETITGSLWAITLASIKNRVSRYRQAHLEEMEHYQPASTFVDHSCYNSAELEKKRPPHLAGLFDKNKEWSSVPLLNNSCPSKWGDKSPIWNPLGLCVYEVVHGERDGMLLPPVVLDVTGDGKNDLVVSLFGDHTLLLDGANGATVWDLFLPDTQTYRSANTVHEREREREREREEEREREREQL